MNFNPLPISLLSTLHQARMLLLRKNYFFSLLTKKLTQGFIVGCRNNSGPFQQLHSDLCYRGLRLDRYGNCRSILQRIDFRPTDLFPNRDKLVSIFMKMVRSKEGNLQWSTYETQIVGVFCDFLWHKTFVCINCETHLTLECVHKCLWPTGFKKSEIHRTNLEQLLN